METFTTGVSGASHILHRNIGWKLFARLTIPDMVGGALGAYVLSNLDAGIARPFVMTYLTAVGAHLFWRGIHDPPTHKPTRVIEPLGLAGDFLDAAGGGGWGPVVTGNLLVQGAEPRKTIGTVSASEFVLTTTISATFIAILGWEAFTEATLGLLIGGIAAAPLGAFIVKKPPAKGLLVFGGILLMLTSAYGIYKALA